ncbi:MAG TPA: DUF3131 domain-containing protein [Campylobacterales bacterium]|nr:DUF3131 domain-containing protein [Sulfurimonas sp.]HIP51210.1 DUF3131 domain-containing protein [Campylobacterales bacterium]
MKITKQSNYIYLFVFILFIALLVSIYRPLDKKACTIVTSTEENSSFTLADDDKWYSGFYDSVGLKAGECIEPTATVSPCELRCAPSQEELKMARIAWKYIENNFNEKTGLTAAAHKYPSAATWDWSNAVYAIYAARKFKIITQTRYEDMMKKFLTTMQKMPLFNNELPNKTYNTNSGKMVNYVNKVVKDGIGWSAADLARLLSSLNMIEQCEETLAPEIEKLMLRYRYCRALSVEGDLYGGTYTNGKLNINHEALTGYEEYLGRGYELWGHNASEARQYKFLKEVEIYGVKIPTDTRPFFSNFVESEPFWYLGFEYGVDDPESSKYIKNMYTVQEERYKRTGQITAVTEDNIDRRPYFLFNTVYTNGEAWKTINQHGADYDEYKTVSTKAGIGMRYLFDTPYSNKVFNYLKNNYDAKKGYYAGIYEKRPGQNKAMTLNTNSIILEAMLSSKMGPLQKLKKIESRGTYDNYRNTINNFRCLPTEKKALILEPFAGTESNSSADCGCEGEALQAAKIAWNYFENNYNPETGLVNGKNKYKTIKPEHIGKTIMATISAESLDIIYKDVFEKRMSKLIFTLKKMKVYHKELPNLYYNAKTAKMVKKDGSAAGTAGGWDLYSVAQMMTGLYHLQRDYPQYREDIFSIVAKWDFKRAVLEKKMQNRWFNGKDKGGADDIMDPAKEFYIHNALKFFNIKSYSHLYDERNLDYKAAYGYEVPMGFEDRITNGESYLWTMMEQPYYLKYKHYSSNIYLALKDRYTITGKFATSTEESLDRKPYWVQNTIYNEGKLWDNLDTKRKPTHKRGLLSTKAAFVYDALYGDKDDYAKTLMREVKSTAKEGYGWYGGIYLKSKYINKSLNIHTNAAVLESLNYKKEGNFYYAKEKKLAEQIALHKIDKVNKFYIESKPIELRYDAQKLMELLADNNEIARVERKGIDFVVRIGQFDTKKEALDFLDTLDVNLPRAHVAQGDVISDNFMLATRYVKYDYHIPYKNILIDKEENKPYKSFLKRYKAKQKVAKAKKN